MTERAVLERLFKHLDGRLDQLGLEHVRRRALNLNLDALGHVEEHLSTAGQHLRARGACVSRTPVQTRMLVRVMYKRQVEGEAAREHLLERLRCQVE
jgi:hypothetical protein